MRTFLAIDLANDIQAALEFTSDDLRQRMPEGSVRWVKPESIHLTLKFLGEIKPEFIRQVEELVRPLAEKTPKMRLRVAGLGVFPRPSRPRVLWVGVKDENGQLMKLYEHLQSSFETVGIEAERRRFTPHLTLGRVRRGLGKRDEERISQVIEAMPEVNLGEIEAAELILFESQLGPGGATYRPLRTFEFSAE